MAKGDRANLESLLRSAWERQSATRLKAIPMAEGRIKQETGKPPWYESNLLWVPFSLGIGILLAVVAAMKQDLRWLLWLSGLCFIVTVWVGARQIKARRTRRVAVGIAAFLIYLALYRIDVWLRPTSAVNPPVVSTLPAPPVPRGAFDRILPQWKLTYRPELLTLRDLFLIDSGAPGTANSGSVFVDIAKTISVDYSISVNISEQSKFLSFYLSRNDTQTKDICKYLAERYDYILKNVTQMDTTSKGPGDSGTLSSKDAVFTGVIYIYHETYLPAEDAVEVTKVYKEHNLSVILRSIDYLTEKRMEATVLKLRREQSSH